MRQLQTQEVLAVSGAGLLTGALSTGVQAGVAAGTGLAQGGKVVVGGLAQAGTIVAKPLAATTVRLLGFLI
jgi:hypothetical protein